MVPRPAGTESFRFNHTMYRIKDPKVSLKFYQEIIGMQLVDTKEMESFTLYFLAFPQPGDENKSAAELSKGRAAREGILELTWNHGTEKDADFKGYANGNSDPGKGFGHIAVTMDNLQEACDRFEKLGVKFQKRPQDGKMNNIAFILDPDSYWIELVAQATLTW